MLLYYCVVLLALNHWPAGTYGLPKTKAGCPLPASQWTTGNQIIVHLFQVYCTGITLLASESCHEGSNTPSVRRCVVDEERMSPGHWLGLVLYVSFSALTLMVGR